MLSANMTSLISGNMRGDLIGLVAVGNNLFRLPLLIVLHREVWDSMC
jgi:hypothetical protein